MQRRLCSPTAASSRRITTPISRPHHGGGRALGAAMRQEPLYIQCCCTVSVQNRANGHWRLAVMLWGVLVCLLPGTEHAVKPGAPVRIGVLTASWGPPPAVMGLIEGLVGMDYRENADFVIGVRFTQGDSAILPTVARELVADGVDILFCTGETEAKAARQTTTTHPIVCTAVGDPAGQGLIKSYAQPGGNITWVVDLNMD